MEAPLTALLVTAVSIGFIHTVIGPDHYLPFIAMARVRNWSLLRTAGITFFCGVGHVGSSVVLGFIGIGLGVALSRLELIEGMRGDLAAWALTAFGLIYGIWGLKRAWRRKAHAHDHYHGHAHGLPHEHGEDKKSVTPWVLFTIFVLGPCEPLIPLLMYPAVKESLWGVFLAATAFGAATISTMMGIVLLASIGIRPFSFARIERYSHALAGLALFLCGLAIQLGL
ncbi:MAG: sulfite exporter TauE/SafE family protein [Planctomycetota bacterium]